MKTTVDISDTLLASAKSLAKEENTTLRALIETGLRNVLKERQAAPVFRLRDASFRGKGLQPAYAGADWARIRIVAEQDRSQ